MKLIPRDDPKISARTEYFNKLISKVPIGAISLGSFMHPEFCGTTKSPFLGPAKQTFLSKSNHIVNSNQFLIIFFWLIPRIK